MLFENVKFKIEYIEECIDNDANRSFIFTVDIKDFDTPTLNLVYDLEEDIIVKTYIDEQFENISGGLSSNAKDVLNIISVMEIPVMTESQLQSPFKNN